MATSIFFLGRTIATPGSYTEIDASGLEQVGLGALGIVGLLAEGEGGIPVSAITDVQSEAIRLTSPEQVRTTFRSGDMREGAAILFEPSADPAILAGAQQVVAMKVNPAVQSTASLANSSGDIIDLTSADYGAFTEQISVTVGNGSTQGKLVTLVFENLTESADNIGGDDLVQIEYETASTAWTTALASFNQAGALTVHATRAQAGLAAEITVFSAGPSTVEIPTNADNAGRVVTVYGIVGSTPTQETLVVSASALVVGTVVFDEVFGATMDQDAVTSAVVIDETGGLGQFDVSIGTRETGAKICQGMFVANTTVAISSGATGVTDAQIWGRNAAGQIIGEQLTLSGTIDRRTVSTASFSQIDAIVLGDIVVGDVVTFRANALASDATVQTNLQRLGDFVNARTANVDVDGDGTAETDVGFVLTFGTGSVLALVTSFDEIEAVDVVIASPGASFMGDLQAVLDYFNFQATLVDGAQSTLTNQVSTFTITGLPGSFTYIVTINGTEILFTDDGSPTNAEVVAGIIAAITAMPDINRQVVATAGVAATDIVVTSRFGSAFTTAVSANLSVALTTAAVGAKVVVANTVAPIFLSGGTEGTSAFSDWQTALNLLKQLRVNTVVPLTGDPAVHAAAEAHAAFMGGIGRSERDVKVGLSALGALDVPLNILPNKISIKAQIVNLNSRHVAAFAQTIDRFNTAGERTTFLPWFQACVAAGMQSGGSVGTALTFKFGRVLAINQDTSWNPIDDSGELIESGLCFMENVEGVGRRFVRGVTTHLSSDNIAFIEQSVNQAVNFTTFNFRTNMEVAVGQPGFAGTINAAKGVAINTLGLLQEEGAIVASRSLFLELIVDVLEVSVELAPVIPINFVKSVIHLVTVQQAAA